VTVIQPIVEGHGEVSAVPVLLRRLVEQAGSWDVRIRRPIRRPRHSLIRRDGVEKAVRLALHRDATAAVLLLFDGDRDCPATLGPLVQRWASAAAGGVPCQVVLAHREYEAWFLAALDSLGGERDIEDDPALHPEPEGPRGAKEALEARMSRPYLETADQAPLSARFSLETAFRRSRSFRKLANAFGAVLHATGHETVWPLPAWMTAPVAPSPP